MALIICSECGKEFSNKAASCPNCGCPIEEIIKEESLDNSQEEVEIEETGSTASKAWAAIKTGANTISERQKEAIKCTKSIGPVQNGKTIVCLELMVRFRLMGKKQEQENLCLKALWQWAQWVCL